MFLSFLIFFRKILHHLQYRHQNPVNRANSREWVTNPLPQPDQKNLKIQINLFSMAVTRKRYKVFIFETTECLGCDFFLFWMRTWMWTFQFLVISISQAMVISLSLLQSKLSRTMDIVFCTKQCTTNSATVPQVLGKGWLYHGTYFICLDYKNYNFYLYINRPWWMKGKRVASDHFYLDKIDQ